MRLATTPTCRFMQIILVAAATTMACRAPETARANSEFQAVEGTWLGTLSASESNQLRIAYEITSGSNGELQATLVSLDQGAQQIAATKTIYKNGLLHVQARSIGATFEGRLQDDGSTIKGSFKQGRNRIPLILKRLDEDSIATHEPNGALSPRLEKLRILLEDGLVCFPAKGDYSFFLPHVEGKQIVFFAESPHRVPELRSAAYDFAVFMAGRHDARVFAMEMTYGLHPFMETASLEEKRTNQIGLVPSPISKYNESVSDEEKLLVTAIDIEHSINHTKHQTIQYLNYLGDLSSSADAKNELRNSIPDLSALSDRKEIHRYLDDLEKLFVKHRTTFAETDWEEIEFSFDLMRASVDFQLLKYESTAEFQEIRGKFFRETINRAHEKAKMRNGSLLCYVGGTHASKVPREKDDYNTAMWNEAEFFHTAYPETKGKVASLLVTVLTYRGGRERWATGDLEDIAYLMSGDLESVFISLADLADHAEDLSWSKYFTKDGPKYDGVLFIKNASRPK